jgi:hypothetical protein
VTDIYILQSRDHGVTVLYVYFVLFWRKKWAHAYTLIVAEFSKCWIAAWDGMYSLGSLRRGPSVHATGTTLSPLLLFLPDLIAFPSVSPMFPSLLGQFFPSPRRNFWSHSPIFRQDTGSNVSHRSHPKPGISSEKEAVSWTFPPGAPILFPLNPI